MDLRDFQPRAAPAEEAELAELIAFSSAALQRGDRAAALRTMDRARRITRESPEIEFLYGRLLLTDGRAADAVQFLEKAAQDRSDPRFVATLVHALCNDGRLDEAAFRLDTALSLYATGPGDLLAEAARLLVAMSQPRWDGWIAVSEALHTNGEVFRLDSPAHLTWGAPGAGAPGDHLIEPAGGDWTSFSVAAGKRRWGANQRAQIGDRKLLGAKGLAFPPDFGLDGRAGVVEDEISGWVSLRWSPDTSPNLKIEGAAGFNAIVESSLHPLHPGRHNFKLARAAWGAAGNRFEILATLPDGSWRPLPDSPLLVKPGPAPAGRRRSIVRSPAATAGTRLPVDIVIPVYRGFAETLGCIKAAADTSSGRAEIVVIDDASPEPGLPQALDGLAKSGVITLLRNDRNLGFPQSVNRGLELHGDRDVIILNSDVEVFPGWFERISAAAYRDERIGTVTPLTNSGTIASYPLSEDPNCDSRKSAALDRLTAQINAGIAIDVPTAVGFCTYIRRDCLAETGLFDEITFGRGYGEENDFCMRASWTGWRHILAADVFVRHIGGRSFGAAKAALADRNIRLLNLRYPGYNQQIQDYAARDPAHGARRRLDEARLIATGRRYVLMVTLALDGGVRRAVDDRIALSADRGLTALVLKPHMSDSGRCALSIDGEDYEDLSYRTPEEMVQLFGMLGKLQIERIELHHFLGLSGELIDALFQAGPPVEVAVHDYIWYCPQITLIDGANQYCGEPDLAGCEACVSQNGTNLTEPLSVQGLRERSARWLAAADKVVAPTRDVARRFARHFPEIPVTIEALEEEREFVAGAPPDGERLKVAVIGAIGRQKGYDILLAAARDAASRNLPIEYVVIGYSRDDGPLQQTGRAFVTGQYREHEIEELIARERPNLALFASVTPETWCYTLTHALKAGLPIAGFDHGAVAERVRGVNAHATLFPLSTTGAQMNDAIIGAFGHAPRQKQPIRVNPDGHTRSPVPPRSPDRALVSVPLPASRSMMAPNLQNISATVEVLPLVKGLYLFSVQATNSKRIGDDHELTLPALQIGLGPGTPASHAEFMYGPRTDGAWLCEQRDTIVVKITEPSTMLMLTSLTLSGTSGLEIEVRRLDNPAFDIPRTGRPNPQPAQEAARPAVRQPQIAAPRPGAAVPVPAPIPPPGWHKQRSLRLGIVVHVQNRGDMQFSEAQWSGAIGQRLAIEAFTIAPLEVISPDMIEYKAVTASGVETAWIGGGSPCGTKGKAMPLTGFAIRLKPQPDKNFICQYGALLVSGKPIGPARNGAPCRSTDANDGLGAIWVTIYEESQLAAPASDPQRAEAATQPKRGRAPTGPKFSVFREQAASTVDQ